MWKRGFHLIALRSFPFLSFFCRRVESWVEWAEQVKRRREREKGAVKGGENQVDGNAKEERKTRVVDVAVCPFFLRLLRGKPSPLPPCPTPP